MRDALGPGTILGYCANVHAGATFDAMLSDLRTHAMAVKQIASPARPMGVGLWLSAAAAREALEQQRLDELRQFLASSGLIAFTFNGFPHGDFHGPVVKHRVYEPDWTSPARLAYTMDLVTILSALVPSGGEGSISTLPIAWRNRDQLTHESTLAAAAKNLVAVAQRLHRLEQDTGKLIHLDLEPEPGCLLDMTTDVVNFFEHHLPSNQELPGVRRHLRVCLDVCHLAVMFEDPWKAVRLLHERGISIGKTQISSAIEAPMQRLSVGDCRRAVAQLRRFAEDRYLHQTVIGNRAGDSAEVLYDDLPGALDGAPLDGPWRVHFHVPIFLESFGLLRTTRGHITDTLEALSKFRGCAHFEVETYAWGVLPPELQVQELSGGIARELQWLQSAACP